MKKDWQKYINRQKYNDCQVVTAVNAYYYLTGKIIQYGSEEYEDIRELAGALYGNGATCIEKVHQHLGLKVSEGNMFLSDFLWKYNMRTMKPKIKRSQYPFPIEMTCFHKRTGYHSALIIDYSSKCDAFRVCNFREVTTELGWMFSEDMFMIETRIHSGEEGLNSDVGKPWRYRSFTLKKST